VPFARGLNGNNSVSKKTLNRHNSLWNFGKLPSGDLEGSFLIFESHRFMSHTGVRKLELAEANDAISLASLRKMAEALDCELHYALIPRTSLAQQLQVRAEVVVTERMRPILHTMALEDQTFQDAVSKFQFESSVKDLIEGSRRECWEKINISQGEEWVSRQKKRDLLQEGFVRDLHRKMFDRTW
jgi:predicted DNA-binding mobile mystery protein A